MKFQDYRTTKKNGNCGIDKNTSSVDKISNNNIISLSTSRLLSRKKVKKN